MTKDCIFCNIVKGDIPSEKLYEDSDCLAFRDIAPESPVHFLVIPKRHIESLAEASGEDSDLLGKLLVIARDLAASLGLRQEGFRVVINSGEDAGQTVPHLHVHVLGGRALGWPPG